jgi:hypothetical protein
MPRSAHEVQGSNRETRVEGHRSFVHFGRLFLFVDWRSWRATM